MRAAIAVADCGRGARSTQCRCNQLHLVGLETDLHHHPKVTTANRSHRLKLTWSEKAGQVGDGNDQSFPASGW
jgi:hypothetical protein